MNWRTMAEHLRNWGRWGADDELGTLNLITSAAILRGAASIRLGKVVSLGVNYDSNGPAVGTVGRFNPIHYMTATPLDGAEQGERRGVFRFLDDHIVMPLQTGTQWDGLSHVYYEGQMYNGISDEVVKSHGVTRLGVEKWANGIVSRGVLLDVAHHRGVEWMDRGDAILTEELEAIEQVEGVRVEEGDVLLVRTGWCGKFLADRNGAAFWGGEPGLSASVLPWLHERGVAAVAMDNWGVEVRPDTVNEWEGFTYSPVHCIALRDMGLPLGEIWNLEALSRACAEHKQYDFLLSAAPLPFTGAVGSPLNPLAIM